MLSSGKMMLLELATVDQPITPKRVQVAPIQIADYIFLAKVVAHKFRRKVEKIEDTEAYSIACVELVKAAVSYNPTVQEDFSRYAYRAMLNGVIEHIRRRKAKKRTANFETISDKDFRNIPEDLDTLPENLPVDLLRTLLADIDDTEQDRSDKALLTEIYLGGTKIPVIAEKYGISRVTVYNRLRRILGKIRQRHAGLIEIHGGIVDERPDQHEGKPHHFHRGGEG